MPKKKPKPERRGRPELPDDQIRASPLLVRLRKGERQAFEEAASAAGLTLSAWVRAALERAARGPKGR